jgi:hypothetical protein
MSMVGLRTEVLKASILAVLTAILLGASTYMLSPYIETKGPRQVGTLNAYTERGVLGSNIVGSVYFYNENISIFAHLKDASNNSVADAPVTFLIHGPSNSNITLSNTTKTNSSGVAVTKLPVLERVNHPETILGIWDTVATAEIAGTQIADSLAFEVVAPPNPFIDVYTDRGGNGPNTSSEPYSRNETVNLYASVSNGTNPLENSLVAFAVYRPTNKLILLTTNESDASGIAQESFRIPPVNESIGPWRVIVSVRIKDQVFIDTLTFECLP